MRLFSVSARYRVPSSARAMWAAGWPRWPDRQGELGLQGGAAVAGEAALPDPATVLMMPCVSIRRMRWLA